MVALKWCHSTRKKENGLLRLAQFGNGSMHMGPDLKSLPVYGLTNASTSRKVKTSI
jgi:hypothetical protein